MPLLPARSAAPVVVVPTPSPSMATPFDTSSLLVHLVAVESNALSEARRSEEVSSQLRSGAALLSGYLQRAAAAAAAASTVVSPPPHLRRPCLAPPSATVPRPWPRLLMSPSCCARSPVSSPRTQAFVRVSPSQLATSNRRSRCTSRAPPLRVSSSHGSVAPSWRSIPSGDLAVQ